MGNAAIYYYPDPDGPVQAIDLLTGLSELTESPDAVIDVSESTVGLQTRQGFRTRLRIRAVLERFSGQSTAGKALHRDLFSMRHHLMMGGSIALAADTAKAWCGFTRASTSKAGDTTLLTKGDPTSAWAGGTLTSGDEVMIFGLQPAPPYEMLLASSLSGGRVTLQTGLRYNYDTVVGVRARNYYPALVLPAGMTNPEILISERRNTYTLELELVEDTAALEVLSQYDANTLRGTTAASGKTSIASGQRARGTDPALGGGPMSRGGK